LVAEAGSAFVWTSGYRTRARLVIRGQSEWAAVWDVLWGRDARKPPLPPVDFARETVLLAASGTRPTGGHSIAIPSVEDADGTLKVQVVERSPGRTCMTTQVITHPATAVAVARVTERVELEEHSAVDDCR
jgi:hypothetical protein